ncbi:MAG: magnesium transporter CorA, partial [Betaproteobacteria bacterium]
MRVFFIGPAGIRESDQLPTAPAQQTTVWISCSRAEFEANHESIQAALQALCGIQLVNLHISDLLNAQLPSRYDYTAQYDLLVFRRLATAARDNTVATGEASGPVRRSGPPILHRIDTSPVGFAIFDNVLLSVHPADC